MRFLKNKILKAQEAKNELFTVSTDFKDTSSFQDSLPSQSNLQESDSDTSSPKKVSKRTRKSKHHGRKSRPCRPTKNISINYGKAISSFAVSHLALPYLQDHLTKHNVTHEEFIDFIGKFKESIRGIESFKYLLQIGDEDEPKVKVYKELFKIASEVFIKYFSVNWIIHGKVTNKLVYLQFRGKMLRRVQNPEGFTYIKKRNKKDRN